MGPTRLSCKINFAFELVAFTCLSEAKIGQQNRKDFALPCNAFSCKGDVICVHANSAKAKILRGNR